MKIIRTLTAFLFIFTAVFTGCDEIESYPVEPIIKYKDYSLYVGRDTLGNNMVLLKLEVEFTDGDGDIGIKQPFSQDDPDSLKFNFFMKMYDYAGGSFREVQALDSTQNYRIPYISRKGQNKSLKGTIVLDIEFKEITYDTIFYSFYLLDRHFHKSNVDSTDVIVLSGIDLKH